MTARRRRGRGGKGGHEPQLRIRQREQEVVRLATEGRSQHEIAHEVDLSQAAISKILRRVDERWMRENVDRMARYKAEQIRKLDHLFRESVRAWEGSKAQRTRRRQRKTEANDHAAGGTVAEVIVDDSHGDSRYLEAARRILADLSRLQGVDRSGRLPGSDTDEPVVFTLDLGGRNQTSPGRSADTTTKTRETV